MIKKIASEDHNLFQKMIAECNIPEYELDIGRSIGTNLEQTIGYAADGKVVAMLEYGNHDRGLCISLMFTMPGYRNRGIGAKLIDYIKKCSEDNVIFANPYTVESEIFFIKSGFKVDTKFDPDDSNTVIYRKSQNR